MDRIEIYDIAYALAARGGREEALFGGCGKAAREAYDVFVRGMPAGWYACYVGVFPGREAECKTPWVRVECIVGNALQRAYAESATVLREHLEHAGLDGIGEDAIEGVRELAQSPFPLELQFNVGPDGTALPVLSASVRFQPRDWRSDGGREAVGRLDGWLQACGLADERCGLLAQAVFAKRMERGGERATASCFPAFVKLRWREGVEPCAKAYLLARVG